MNENPFNLYTLEYEEWFEENAHLFESELLALKRVIPGDGRGLEIGVGSGVFAERLNIRFGIDPSENMLTLAEKRGLKVDCGYAENLPYSDCSFDFTAFITSICFIGNPLKAVSEAYRVTVDGGCVVIAFLNSESALGKKLAKNKENNKFYKHANFYSPDDIKSFLVSGGFEPQEIFQTLANAKSDQVEEPSEGSCSGGFVVVKGIKRVIK